MISLPPPSRKANRRVRVSLLMEDGPIADREAWRALFRMGALFNETGSGSQFQGLSL